MGYIVTHRVKNSKNKTVGFIVDGKYLSYDNVIKNIRRIDNVKLVSNKVIRSISGELPIISLKDVNMQRYNKLCKDNLLIRDIKSEFEYWLKNRRNKILSVVGPRQVGKTTEILKFAYEHYENVIYINLANSNLSDKFERALDIEPIRFGIDDYCLESNNNEYDDSSNTVIIIDEIQESPKIYNSMRSLQSDLNCDIIVTGSFLGKILNSKYFKPSGNTYEVEMLPLSFKEFCRAFKCENKLMSIDLYGKSNKEDYIELTNLYRTYLYIGGYPAVVDSYLKKHDINECNKELKDIVLRFTEESAPHFNNDKCSIIFEKVYSAAVYMMCKEKKGTSPKDVEEITEFVKASTKEYVSRSEVNNAISWLNYSKIIGSCDLYNQGNILDMLTNRRFYFMDCGMARYLASFTSLNEGTVNGMLAENFAYTELYRVYMEHGGESISGNRPCCSVYGNYELDFMINFKNGTNYGIEVKSNRSSKHESLNVYLKKKFIDEAYLVEITKGGKGETVKSIPIYTVGCRFPYK